MGTLGSKLFFKGEDGIFFFYFFLTSVNWDSRGCVACEDLTLMAWRLCAFMTL